MGSSNAAKNVRNGEDLAMRSVRNLPTQVSRPSLAQPGLAQQESSDPPVQPTSAIDEMIADAQETTRIAKHQPKIKSYKPKPDAQL